VIKPLIGAWGYGVKMFNLHEIDLAKAHFNQINLGEGVLLQPVIRDDLHEIEYRLVFFNRIYSHTVLKQETRHTLVSKPPVALIRFAKQVLAKLPGDLLYARVDCIPTQKSYLLMELELFEPQLYFSLYPPAARLMVQEFAQLEKS
jgi:hypothetical protein